MFFASKGRVFCLSLKVSWTEVEGVTVLTKLAFTASGWLVQLCSKLTPVTLIKSHKSSQPSLLLNNLKLGYLVVYPEITVSVRVVLKS